MRNNNEFTNAFIAEMDRDLVKLPRNKATNTQIQE